MMTNLFVSLKANRTLRVSSLLMALTLFAAGALANGTNPIPYEEDFEDAPEGTIIAGTNDWASTNGWYDADEGTNTVVVTESYTYPLDVPLNDSGSNIVVLSGSVSNLFDHAGGDTNVWVDLMVKPAYSAVQPEVDDDLQLALYFNTNGQIVAKHKHWDDGANFKYPVWSILDHPPVPSNQWVRLTIEIDYLTTKEITDETYFRVRLNGGEPLTTYYGLDRPLWFFQPGTYDLIDPFIVPRNGTWLLNVNADDGIFNLNSIEILGEGAFDDLQVKTSNVLDVGTTHQIVASVTGAGGTIHPGGTLNIPEGDDVTFEMITLDPVNYELDDVLVGTGGATSSVGDVTSYTISNVLAAHTIEAVFVEATGPQYTPKGIPFDWYTSHDLDPNTDEDIDSDDDGALNWEEYVAGTIPTNDASVFMLLGVEYAGTSNKVSWYATTDGGTVTDPFDMLISTNLQTWTTNNIDWPRVDGTHEWWDTNAPAGPVHYRPVILWE